MGSRIEPFFLLATFIGLAACDARIIAGDDDDGGGGDDTGSVDPRDASDADGEDDAEEVAARSGAEGSAPNCDRSPVALFGYALDRCGNDVCCEEMTNCASDFSRCADAGGVTWSLPDGAKLLSCLTDAGCVLPQQRIDPSPNGGIAAQGGG